MRIATAVVVRLLPIVAVASVFMLSEGWSAAKGGPTVPIPVVDLRVGLAKPLEQRAGNLWQGMGQGGIVQLRQGGVAGVLIPFPPTAGSPAQLPIRFAEFRSALSSTQAFNASACSSSPVRIGAWFQLEAPDSLAAVPSEAATWVARGVKVFSLAGRRDSALASSAFPSGPERVVGLTAIGEKLVASVLSAGGLIDVANLSDTALFDVLSLAQQAGRPVLTTRGSARAIRSRPGSLSDSELRGIAASGGVIGLSLDRDLIGDGQSADMADVLHQVDHIIQIGGPDSIAIASGFETGTIPASSVSSATRFPRLAAALAAHGISNDQIHKMFGANALRVLCDRLTHFSLPP